MQRAGSTNVETEVSDALNERGRIFYVFTPERLKITDRRVIDAPFQVLEPFQFIQIVDLPERRLTQKVVEMELSSPMVAQSMMKRADQGLEFSVKNAWRNCLDLIENYSNRGLVVVTALNDMKNYTDLEKIEAAIIPKFEGDPHEVNLQAMIDLMNEMNPELPPHLLTKAAQAQAEIIAGLEAAIEYRIQVVNTINGEVHDRRSSGKGRSHFSEGEKSFAKSVGITLTDTTVQKEATPDAARIVRQVVQEVQDSQQDTLVKAASIAAEAAASVMSKVIADKFQMKPEEKKPEQEKKQEQKSEQPKNGK